MGEAEGGKKAIQFKEKFHRPVNSYSLLKTQLRITFFRLRLLSHTLVVIEHRELQQH